MFHLPLLYGLGSVKSHREEGHRTSQVSAHRPRLLGLGRNQFPLSEDQTCTACRHHLYGQIRCCELKTC